VPPLSTAAGGLWGAQHPAALVQLQPSKGPVPASHALPGGGLLRIRALPAVPLTLASGLTGKGHQAGAGQRSEGSPRPSALGGLSWGVGRRGGTGMPPPLAPSFGLKGSPRGWVHGVLGARGSGCAGCWVCSVPGVQGAG